MNLRGGLAIIRGQLFGFLSSKGFFWTLALGWMTGPVIYLLVWTAASSGGAIGGYDKNGFVLYYLSLIIVNQLTYPTSHWSTGEAINNGSIASALLRPLPLIYGDIGCDMAVKIVCMPFVAVVTVSLGLLFKVQVDFKLEDLGMALAALAFALVIRFLLAHILSLLAFWTQQSGALLSLNDTFIFLFAGQAAPLALFPGFLRELAGFLPYRYMVSYPVEVLMGKLSPGEIGRGFLLQFVWMLVLILICYIVNKKGLKKHSAVGG